jgi:hypothetical protein
VDPVETILPLPAWDHALRDILRAQKGALEVGVEEVVPRLLGQFGDVEDALHAGVVDQDVDLPVLGDRRIDHRTHLVALADVTDHRKAAHPEKTQQRAGVRAVERWLLSRCSPRHVPRSVSTR